MVYFFIKRRRNINETAETFISGFSEFIVFMFRITERLMTLVLIKDPRCIPSFTIHLTVYGRWLGFRWPPSAVEVTWWLVNCRSLRDAPVADQRKSTSVACNGIAAMNNSPSIHVTRQCLIAAYEEPVILWPPRVAASTLGSAFARQ